MSLFEIVSEHFDGEVKVIRSPVFEDERGFLSVTYLKDEMRLLGLPKFVRDLHSRSLKTYTIRGLHYQFDPSMSKLMRVTRGSALMVAVDFYQLSPTFLQYHTIVLSEENKLQVWASPNFARGFCTLEPNTEVQYKCSSYIGSDETVLWNDPDIGIDWPVKNPILSERDRHAQTVKEYLKGRK